MQTGPSITLTFVRFIRSASLSASCRGDSRSVRLSGDVMTWATVHKLNLLVEVEQFVSGVKVMIRVGTTVIVSVKTVLIARPGDSVASDVGKALSVNVDTGDAPSV